MPKLSDLVRDTLDVEIPTGGEPLRITFRKGYISPALAREITASSDETPFERLEILARLVHGAVVRWNLTDDDDQPIPLTPEGVASVDAAALDAILAAFNGATQPDPQNGMDSNGSSSPADDLGPEPVPIGTRS